MPNPTLIGYGEEGYLENPYMGGTALYATGMQINRLIVDFNKNSASQVNRNIVDFKKYVGCQVTLTIENDKPVAMQVDRITGIEKEIGIQVNLNIVDSLKNVGSQTSLTITNSKSVAFQILRNILDLPDGNASQVERHIVDFTKAIAMEIRRDKTFPHINCSEAGYLEQEYLTQEYLGNYFCVAGPMQVSRILNENHYTGSQVELNVVDHLKQLGSQVELNIVDFPDYTAMQVERLRNAPSGAQVLMVLYNTYNLRVLVDFPSRGTSGTNWTSTSTATGDFSVNNLNTDIVEQVWRSVTGTTNVILTCDTEVAQGILIDTIALLNHNLTTSASILFQGSNDSLFSLIGTTITLESTDENIYYIAPEFPTTQYRYWRFIINDGTNSNNYLQIGTIVFGTTVIIQGENFVDELTRRTKHYSDKVPTEGFTNVSNDRALKYATQLEFRNIQYGRGNFKNLKEVFKFARTSLKCLWIPDPRQPDRFAVFGKLVSIPEERHKNMGADAADNVDLSLEIDESL